MIDSEFQSSGSISDDENVLVGEVKSAKKT